jgi:L-asparagine transporter-like permease
VAGDPDLGHGGGFFVLINAINLMNVKFFGEAEFWFAIIKVVAIVGMIGLGAYLLTSGSGGPRPRSPTCGPMAASSRTGSAAW